MKYVVVDTETTGLSPLTHQVLTVGMVVIDVEREFLKVIDEAHIFIKMYKGRINSESMKVNRIDISEHNLLALSPKRACEEINDFITKHSLENTPLIGHNIMFDKSFIADLFHSQEMNSLFCEQCEDTMRLWRMLKRDGKVPDLRSRLQDISEFFDIDYTHAHDALADCHITAQAYHQLLRLL